MHPILFEFGPIQIRFYGLMYVIAILVGSFLIKQEVRRKGIQLNDDEVMNFILWSVLGGIFGARIYYVVFNWGYYFANPKEIPAVWHGGLAIHGGLIGGILVAYLYLKRREISFWKIADSVAPAIILGQAFGRFGNFMNGDAHGRPTTLPWGIVFPSESIAGAEFPNTPLHPVMLYEMAINLSIFFFLWFVLRKREYKNGFIFAAYIALYSFGRFIVESFRADSLMMGPLRAAQVVSLTIAIVALGAILKGRLWGGRSQESEVG
ncbi:MAG: prolipoprotein diacylglyceryl transferase [Deltaproteobacteria bacterium RIFCSPLOWO2_12_FULL_43_16]|nr:MAG: prolipoprotein diacylglyceryl transferase [Deltaproteobacteria bacterium RIFCSPHIGHO2_02_FULL_43_33]OGQ61170.1 MAG: prolipoprotein diacylglyceryl transferase [Deltaproteobacteria bacterium RIFCSPLOWO2_12_FULL_43_16]HBR17756.1 prolipoprotein diacylglyceryl transferase [Deltaproteobacteria bacterium]